MTDTPAPDSPAKGPDYAPTLYLPVTDFPMRGGLPQKEPELLARWKEIDLYGKLRATSAGRPKFVLHDGPPTPTATFTSGMRSTRSSRTS